MSKITIQSPGVSVTIESDEPLSALSLAAWSLIPHISSATSLLHAADAQKPPYVPSCCKSGEVTAECD